MPLRRLLHQLLHNEHFIQKVSFPSVHEILAQLSESAPMRFLARLTATQYHKASELFHKTVESRNLQHYLKGWQERLDEFKTTLSQEYKKALEEKKSKDQQQKPSK